MNKLFQAFALLSAAFASSIVNAESIESIPFDVFNGQSLRKNYSNEVTKSEFIKNQESKACYDSLSKLTDSLEKAQSEGKFKKVKIDLYTFPIGIYMQDIGNDNFAKKCVVTVHYDVKTDSELVKANSDFYLFSVYSTGYYFTMLPSNFPN